MPCDKPGWSIIFSEQDRVLCSVNLHGISYSRWKADHRQRSRASPHIKTYLRATDDQYKQLLWFLVTSANLSKAGKRIEGNVVKPLRSSSFTSLGCLGEAQYSIDDSIVRRFEAIRRWISLTDAFSFSYEIGVLFVPHQFSQTSFPVFDAPAFPLPYDLPPVKYQSTGKWAFLFFLHAWTFSSLSQINPGCAMLPTKTDPILTEICGILMASDLYFDFSIVNFPLLFSQFNLEKENAYEWINTSANRTLPHHL